MKPEHVIERHGKRYVLYAGLITEAHDRGIKSIYTDMVQIPSAANGDVAVVKALVEMEDGGTFSGIGDASAQNVGRAIAPHIIRMAETRAKARAIRDALPVTEVAFEELNEDTPGAAQAVSGPRSGPRPIPREVTRQEPKHGSGSAPPASDSQLRFIAKLSEEKFDGGIEEMQQEIGVDVDELTIPDASALIEKLKEA